MKKTNTVFPNCSNQAVASQIFPIDFIVFLFSDYCWVNQILWNHAALEEDLLCEDIYQN